MFYEKLKLVEPSFDSSLTDLVIDLDHLRRKELSGSTYPQIFFQLKKIFHFLESLESARIEGNRTTLSELVERKIGDTSIKGEPLREIENIEKAMTFIEAEVSQVPINSAFVSHLHQMAVAELSPEKEGDRTPGEYRKVHVAITGAQHVPPEFLQVPEYMDELFLFINDDTSSKYDLLKTALVHHRFLWIHPFSNGNGRTVRLLTYALLLKQGFNLSPGRLINPTAVFCNDRNQYYHHLALADTGEETGLLKWCEYVLSGLRSEIEKIDQLLDYEYLSKNILFPAIKHSFERELITANEYKVLQIAVEKQNFKAADVKPSFPRKQAAEISRIITGLKAKKMVRPFKENGREYHLAFINNFLLRGVVKSLVENGFVAPQD